MGCLEGGAMLGVITVMGFDKTRDVSQGETAGVKIVTNLASSEICCLEVAPQVKHLRNLGRMEVERHFRRPAKFLVSSGHFVFK